MMRNLPGVVFAVCILCSLALRANAVEGPDPAVREAFQKAGVPRGLCAVLGLPPGGRAAFVTDLAKDNEWTIYFQSDRVDDVTAVTEAADSAGLLGRRIFTGASAGGSVHLAANLVDVLLAFLPGKLDRAEMLRVVRPGGCALIEGKLAVKPSPAGTDDWSHPYHGPDNNPQSRDQLALAPYLTQFIAEPAFGCMPEVTVAAGGRIFKAFGHIAFKEYQNPAINSLLAINAYNGTILWRRPLKEGFMIHRNTLIATADRLYLADDESCKILDATTGDPLGQVVVPEGVSDGKVWKWMAVEDGKLYALVGAEESKSPVQRGSGGFVSGWPWSVWPGYDYKDPKANWGFGRTFLAVDLASRRVLWHYCQDEYIDSRGVCMRGGRIYFYCPGESLTCLDAKEGKPVWKSQEPKLLEAIGPNGLAQNPNQGFATTTYVKCDDKRLFFAGPQRPNLVAVSSAEGGLLWQRKDGNFQLVLREDALYGAGRAGGKGYKFDYQTGRVLAEFSGRRACTRATGSADSLFFRAGEGTVRYIPSAGKEEHIAPMRPPCNSGVIIANGLLYWGPWICGCRLSLFGHIGLVPAGGFDFHATPDASRLESAQGDAVAAKEFPTDASDWPCYRSVPATEVAPPNQVRTAWTWRAAAGGPASPPVTAGGLVFFGQADGMAHALQVADGKPVWKAYTGGQVKSSPALWNGRLYVGSGDGWVYAFEAASGKRLWRFRVGPAERRIPVLGRLISTWPVAGGVAAADGVVYAAAGIAHYDSTYVVALDALTGKLKWSNDSSGRMGPNANGVSLQGPLFISGNRLCFAGGNVYPVAWYDLASGQCQNQPVGITTSARSLFYLPEHSTLDRVSLPGRRSVVTDGRGSLTLQGPPPASAPSAAARGAAAEPRLWSHAGPGAYTAVALADKMVLAAGKSMLPPREPATFCLESLSVQDGSLLWKVPLPAAAVEGGIVVNRDGRIVVSLQNGQIMCLGPS